MRLSMHARSRLFGATLMVWAWTAVAQEKRPSPPGPLSVVSGNGQAVASATAAQTAKIFGLSDLIAKLQALQADRVAGTAPTLDEKMTRLDLLEGVETATLEVDEVVGEISNERNQLGDLRTALQVRRDKTVGRLTTAALLTGSALGTVVTATQFSSLGSTAQNTGDGIGIGSGVLSTLFSIEAARKQAGPSAAVGDSPNMLAPLLGGSPALNTNYPPPVLAYLQSTPAGEDPQRGTRLAQMKQRWIAASRLNAGTADARSQEKLTAATVSEDPEVQLSIESLTNRIAMLGDVQGRVSLIKRDLAMLIVADQRRTNK